ncbi:MAG: DUF4153 domain-containing protein [Bacteroidia bacterium]|nr:DUF4153 domain-containing protein [Bacteroidia bacterium]
MNVIKNYLDVKEISKSFFRFPVTVLLGIVVTLTIIVMYHTSGLEAPFGEIENYCRILIGCGLSIPVSIIISLLFEKYQAESSVGKNVVSMIVTILLFVYAFWVPLDNYNPIIQLSLFSILFHLLVSFILFIDKNDNELAFWIFNKDLFIRYLVTIQFSFVIIMGLFFALLLVEILFGPGKMVAFYVYIYAMVGGVFQIWFFTAGVPKNFNAKVNEFTYPKILKILVQYILLPLLSIYIIILYVYGIKILLQWDLPRGWLAWFINVLSVFGVFAFLLLWPLRSVEQNKWVQYFSKWFYVALLPLLVLLFVAIGKRISDYGFTVNRYFNLIIGIWLVFISVFNLITKNEKIKFIPLSLFVTLLLSMIGPWSYYSVSENSQVRILKEILEKNKILVNGKIQPLTKSDSIPDTDKFQIYSVLRYLYTFHSLEPIQAYTNIKLNNHVKLIWNTNNDTILDKIVQEWGMNDARVYYSKSKTSEEDNDNLNSNPTKYFYISENIDSIKTATCIDGYQYAFNFRWNDFHSNIKYLLEKDTLEFSFNKNTNTLNIILSNQSMIQFSIQEWLENILHNKLMKNNSTDIQLESKLLIYDIQNNNASIRIFFKGISGSIEQYKTATIDQMEVSVYLSLKNKLK